jgi:hypothetical protein
VTSFVPYYIGSTPAPAAPPAGAGTWLYHYYATTPSATTVVPEPDAATFLEALQTRLVGLDALESLSGVWLNNPPPGAAFPYLIFHVIDQDAEINTSESYWESALMQYDVLSTDAGEAHDLGTAAREALLPRSTNPPLEFADGYEMARLPGRRRGPYDDGGGDPGGRTVWRYRFEMTHMIGRD